MRLTDGTYIMESKKIALHLEKLHPSPSLHLDSPYQSKIEAVMPQLFVHLAPVFVPMVPRNILNPASQEYFIRTRERRFGVTLSELEHGPKGGDVAWAGVTPVLQSVAAMLKENPEGPLFLGNEVSYADFVFAGFLRMFQRLGDGVFDKVLDIDRTTFVPFYEAVQKYMRRDDH